MKMMVGGELKEVCCYCNTMTGDHHEACPNNPDRANYLKRRAAEQKERLARKYNTELEALIKGAKYFVTMTDWANLWRTGIGWQKKGEHIHKLVIPCRTKRIAR